jgi:hypothetical protein
VMYLERGEIIPQIGKQFLSPVQWCLRSEQTDTIGIASVVDTSIVVTCTNTCLLAYGIPLFWQGLDEHI